MSKQSHPRTCFRVSLKGVYKLIIRVVDLEGDIAYEKETVRAEDLGYFVEEFWDVSDAYQGIRRSSRHREMDRPEQRSRAWTRSNEL